MMMTTSMTHRYRPQNASQVSEGEGRAAACERVPQVRSVDRSDCTMLSYAYRMRSVA